MFGKSSSWLRSTAPTQRGLSLHLQPAPVVAAAAAAAVQRSTTRHRLAWVAVAALGVALGCTSEDRQFGDQTVDGGVSIGETSSRVTTDTSSDGTTTASGKSSDETLTSDDVTPTDGRTESTDGGSDSAGSWDTTREAGATSDATEEATTTSDSASTSPTLTTDVPDDTSDSVNFGVGAPPDYGSLGSGDGRVLVVNTLESGAPVDVWLAGSDTPIAVGLAGEAATRVTVERGAQRVVFTSTGTHDVVGCSEWFPLRGAEQWAVVTSGGEHSCSGSGDGSTSSFRQQQPLAENPVRFVHATRPDSFSFIRNEQAEPGNLSTGETLNGSSLPACTSGCEVNYRISASGVDTERSFTLQVSKVEELPIAGEVLLVVLGDVRQDWPAEADALRLLRVDLDASTYSLRRDPEIAFGRFGETSATFSISTPPSSMVVATVEPYCNEDQCPLETRVWRAGTNTFFLDADEGAAELTVDLEAGHRYVLLATANSTHPLYWLEADFDRSPNTAAYVRGINLQTSEQPLTFGAVFGGTATPIDSSLTSIPWGDVSDGNGGQVPEAENTRIVVGDTPEALGSSCFYSVDFRAGYRGYLIELEPLRSLDITSWPPTAGYHAMICS